MTVPLANIMLCPQKLNHNTKEDIPIMASDKSRCQLQPKLVCGINSPTMPKSHPLLLQSSSQLLQDVRNAA